MERVKGCKLGLDHENPKLPEEICYSNCDWRIKDSEHNNCMWSLVSDPENNGMSLRCIAKMLGVTHESVRQILNNAVGKITFFFNEDHEISPKVTHRKEYSINNLHTDDHKRLQDLMCFIDSVDYELTDLMEELEITETKDEDH